METSDRTRIAIYYSIWATICAAVAGLVVALIHTWFFSYNPGRSAVIETLFSGVVAAVGIAAAQGAVALVTAGLLARLCGGPPARPPAATAVNAVAVSPSSTGSASRAERCLTPEVSDTSLTLSRLS